MFDFVPVQSESCPFNGQGNSDQDLSLFNGKVMSIAPIDPPQIWEAALIHSSSSGQSVVSKAWQICNPEHRPTHLS